MRYAVEILRTAQKQLSRLDRQAQSRIIDSIRQLGADPRPSGCKKLSGRSGWRIRIGDYRVLYFRAKNNHLQDYDQPQQFPEEDTSNDPN